MIDLLEKYYESKTKEYEILDCFCDDRNVISVASVVAIKYAAKYNWINISIIPLPDIDSFIIYFNNLYYNNNLYYDAESQLSHSYYIRNAHSKEKKNINSCLDILQTEVSKIIGEKAIGYKIK